MDNAVRSFGPDGGLGSLIVAQLLTERVDRDAAFIYIPVEHLPQIQQAQYDVLDGMDASITTLEPVDAEDLHLTLLYIERVKEDLLEEFYAQLNLIMPVAFTVDVTSSGTFPEAEEKPVVLHVNPSPSLIRLQNELFNTAFSLGMPLSVFSKPEFFKPHISLAYGLEPPFTPIPDLKEPISIPIDRFVVTRPDYEVLRTIHLPTFRKADILVTQTDESEESVAAGAMHGPSLAPGDEQQDPRIKEMEEGTPKVEYDISIRVLYDPDLEKEAQSVNTTDTLDITLGPGYYEAKGVEHRAGILLRMVGMELARRMLIGPGGPHEWTRADGMMLAPANEMKEGYKYVFGNVSLMDAVADVYASLSLMPEEVEQRGYEDAARWIGYAVTEHEDFAPAELPDFREMAEAIGDIPITAGVTLLIERGGPGSGHFGHKGRPGEVGGSQPRSAGLTRALQLHIPGMFPREPLPKLKVPEKKMAAFGFKDRPVSLARKLEEIRREIAPLEYEEAHVVSPFGEVIFVDTDNGSDYVAFTDEQFEQMHGNILTHNHPSSMSLSKEDVLLAAHAGCHEVHAYGRNGTIYIARFEPRFMDTEEELEVFTQQVLEADTRTKNQFWNWINAGHKTREEAEREHNDYLWKNLEHTWPKWFDYEVEYGGAP